MAVGVQAAAARTSPWRTAGPVDRSRRRRLLLAVLVVFLAAVLLRKGFPAGREEITFWVLAVLWAACAGRWRTWWRAVVRDWLALLLVLFAYDLLRGRVRSLSRALFSLPVVHSSPTNPGLLDSAHVTEPLHVDQDLFGQVPTVWLQQHLYSPAHLHWYDVAVVPVYLSHFVVSIALAVVLWATAYPLFKRFVATLVTLTLTVLVTYALYPAAPPWMASLNHYLPVGIVRIVPATLDAIGVQQVNSAVERGELYANSVAAMPSLHGAIPMMLLVFFWPLVGRRTRALLMLYVAAMAFTLVYAGEHYVIDLLAGWVYAVASVVVVRRILRSPTTPVEEPA